MILKQWCQCLAGISRGNKKDDRCGMKTLQKVSLAVLMILFFASFPVAEGEHLQPTINEDELTEDQTWFIEDYASFKPFWEHLESVPVQGSSWFSVYRLPENVYAIFEPYQEQMVISYLILGGNAALLLDSGLGIGNIKACVDQLTDLPVTVLNSHDHFDHIGGNALFERVMCYNIPSAIETLTEGIPHDVLVTWIDPDAIVNPPEDFSPDTFSILGKAPTATVEDGEIIDLGGRKIEVVYTPGHDDAAIMLIDEENRLLFTGDTWYPGWLYFISEENSLEEYVETFRKVGTIIREKNLKQLYPSHNCILQGTDLFYETTEFMERVLSGKEEYEIIDDCRMYILNDMIALYVY